MSDLKGLWSGYYRYSSSSDVGDTPFKARLSVSDGKLTGMIVENHHTTGRAMKSEIEGDAVDRTLRFTKRYVDGGSEYGRPVEYVGELSADGSNISGTWTLPDDAGTFSMDRSS